MSARYLTACLAGPALLLAGLLPRAVSGPPPCPGDEEGKHQHTRAKLVNRVYPVADLVVPLDEEETAPVLSLAAGEAGTGGEWQLKKGHAPPSAPRTLEDRLIKLVVRAVAPETWSEVGGPATLDYFPPGMALVVRQTPAVHEQVAELLAALRRLQDVEVTAEVRFITVPEACFKRLGLGGATCAPEGTDKGLCPAGQGAACFPRLVFLDDSQVRRFMEAIQADAGTNVVQAPKLTVANGQSSAIDLTERQFFVTGVDLVRKDGQVSARPRSEAPATGLTLSMRPVVSPDRRCVHLGLSVCLTSLVSPTVPVFPISVPLAPRPEEGGHAERWGTQFIQQPQFTRLALRRLLTIPDGKSALLSGWSRLHEVRDESGAPILSDVPYLNRLFKNVGYHCETEHVMVMVTPRIVVAREAEEKTRPRQEPKASSAPCAETGPCAPPAPGAEPAPAEAVAPEAARKRVAELLVHFKQLFKEGKYREAEQCARAAHELDPDNGVAVAAIRLARCAGSRCAGHEMPHVAAPAGHDVSHQAPCCAEGARHLVELLEKYHRACAEGRLAEATQLAVRALALDPTCFSKHHGAGEQVKPCCTRGH